MTQVEIKQFALFAILEDGLLYPCALSAEDNEIIQMTAKLTVKTVVDKPMGRAVDLLGERRKERATERQGDS